MTRGLNLAPDELAFKEVVAANYGSLDEPSFLRDLVHEVVETLKRNLWVDWTAELRQQVYAQSRAAVRRVLQRRGVKPEHLEQQITLRVLEQARATFADWPLLAV